MKCSGKSLSDNDNNNKCMYILYADVRCIADDH
jgi:hypothetical protein